MQFDWWEKILDWVSPRRCEVCLGACDRPSRSICSKCLSKIPFQQVVGVCRYCGREILGLSREFVCEECAEHRPAFEMGGSAVRFEGVARQILIDYKYNRHLWMRNDLVDWLESMARVRFPVDEIDLVLPIPLSLAHRMDRGYNQSSLLAKELARRLDRSYGESILGRRGNPRRQANLNEAERRENVRHSFRVRQPELIRGRTILVIDDVMTTGATLSACAEELKKAGAFRVFCLTVAHGIRTGR